MGLAVKVNLPQTPAKDGNLGLPMGNNDKNARLERDHRITGDINNQFVTDTGHE